MHISRFFKRCLDDIYIPIKDIPEIIIFAIGTNDTQFINSKDNPRVDKQEFRNNLEELDLHYHQYYNYSKNSH